MREVMMFEDERPWNLETGEGTETFLDLIERLDVETEEVNQVRLCHVCEDCNFPVGGRNAVAVDNVAVDHDDPNNTETTPVERDWVEQDFDGVNQSVKTRQSKPCTVTDNEKANCPRVFNFFRDLLCTSGRCNSMLCPRCAGRSRTGRLRVGDIVMVSGIQCSFLPQSDGSVAATMVPSHRCGRHLGVDAAGLRFELMKPDAGDKQRTGMRFWLTSSGYFIEDLAPEVRDALASVKLPDAPRIWKPGDDPNQ
jgi:hypothetical protein